MHSPQHEDLISSLSKPTTTSSSSCSNPSSKYLTASNTVTPRPTQPLPGAYAFAHHHHDSLFHGSNPKQDSTEDLPNTSLLSLAPPSPLSQRIYMSVYSSSSVDTEYSEYSNPPARKYRVTNFQNMSRKITSAEKDQYIKALRTHQINTLVELRRVEKAFAVLGTPDVSEPMTAAWSYYVDSHGLLTELRSLTRNYPFSSHCLDEAKSRVFTDPASNRSWNLCWLVLSKIQNDQLLPYYARYQASQPSMWAGHTPTAEQITELTTAFIAEWHSALHQMLRHWEQPPTR